MQDNQLEVIGDLANNATVSSAGNNLEMLSMRVVTNRSWVNREGQAQSALVDNNIVKFGNKGAFDKLLHLLKKGTGISVKGVVDKISCYQNDEDKSCINVTTNASLRDVLITKYPMELQTRPH